jgi:GntR family transcriptional regulator, rspAB operon transcriptional repressor
VSKRREAYDAIRELILRQEDPFSSPDERTSERVIAEQYVGMSRTPVREALAVLTSTGLVDQIPQSGVEVRNIGSEEAVQAIRLRAGMEATIVEELATHGLESDEPREALRKMDERCESADEIEFMLEDTAFHVLLARLGGFHTSLTMLQGLRDRVHLFRLKQPLDDGAMRAVQEEHAALVDALEARDVDAAATAMRTHMESTRARIEGAAAGQVAPAPEYAGAGGS